MQEAQNASTKMTKNPIQVAGRLFDTLEYLAEHGSSALTDIADSLSLSKSTTYRLISSLQYMGYVTQNPDTGKYEATYKIVNLAEKVTAHTDITASLRPYFVRLMERCGETVHLVRREGAELVYIDKIESYDNSVFMMSRIGMRLPFYRSAVGKALAANLPQDDVEALWNSLTIERTTAYTITDFDDFLENLEEVRRKGYALDNEENESGIRCIGMSLNIESNDTTYAFSISVPITRMDNDRIKELSVYMEETKKEIEAHFSGEY